MKNNKQSMLKTSNHVIKINDENWQDKKKDNDNDWIDPEKEIIDQIINQLKKYDIKADYFLKDLSQKYAFLKITIHEMEQAIKIAGVYYMNEKGVPKKNPILESLKNYIQQFNNVVKTFNDYIIKNNKLNAFKKDDDINDFMRFAKNESDK